MKNRPANVRVEQTSADFTWLHFTYCGPQRRDFTHLYSIRLDRRGMPHELLHKKPQPTAAELATWPPPRIPRGRLARYGRTLNANAKANAGLITAALGIARNRDLIHKARRRWRVACERQAAAERATAARQRIERNGPRLLAALRDATKLLDQMPYTTDAAEQVFQNCLSAIKRATGKPAEREGNT